MWSLFRLQVLVMSTCQIMGCLGTEQDSCSLLEGQGRRGGEREAQDGRGGEGRAGEGRGERQGRGEEGKREVEGGEGSSLSGSAFHQSQPRSTSSETLLRRKYCLSGAPLPPVADWGRPSTPQRGVTCPKGLHKLQRRRAQATGFGTWEAVVWSLVDHLGT